MERSSAAGLVNTDGEVICRKTVHAPEMVGARKKIHATTVSAKVTRIRRAIVGTRTNKLRELAGRASGSPMKTRGMTYNPLSTPHTIKVQFAPCHKPLSVKVINRLNAWRGLEVRLPPRGI